MGDAYCPRKSRLIAEEVAKVNPDLVVRDDNGEIYTVRYEAVNAMLLNEFLKEHRKVEELKAVAANASGGYHAASEHNCRTQDDRRAAAEAN